MTDLSFEYLRTRWEGQDSRIRDIIDAINNDTDWTIFLSSNPAHGYKSLPGLDNPALKRFPNESNPRDLRGIPLGDVIFSQSSRLSEANLSYASIGAVSFNECTLNGTDFSSTHINHVDFTSATLNNVNFSSAIIDFVDFSNADLSIICFFGTQISRCSFLQASVLSIEYDMEPDFPLKMKQYTRIFSIDHDIDKIATSESDFRYFLSYQLTINAAIKRSPVISKIFYVFALYGYSFKRLLLWASAFVLIFGFIYLFSTNGIILSGYPRNPLLPELHNIYNAERHTLNNIITPFYYSVITFTTLGYGDIYPLNTIAKALSAMEAIAGTLFVGLFTSMLLSFFTDKK